MGLLSNNKLIVNLSNFRKIITNLFLDLVLIVLFFVAVLMFINLVSLKTGNSRHALFGTYVIISPSMVPAINIDDAVVIKKVDVSDLKKGDIITFSSSDARYFGYTITHRIYDVSNDYSGNFVFRTKGDGNESIDSAPVLADNIYGKVIFVIPYLGKVQKFLLNPYGWILFIVIPFIIFIVFDVFSIFKCKKLEKQV